MAAKRKVLFLTSEFWQGGAQRHLYEIDKALDRDRYTKSILSLRGLGTNQSWDDHYYSKHLELGTEIFFLEQVNTIRIPTINERIKRAVLGRKLPPERESLLQFLNSYDVILCIGEYTYPHIERWITDEIKAKCHIAIVNSIVQVPENYDRYNKSQKYNFISGFQKEEVAFELNGFTNFGHSFFPLSIACNHEKALWKPHTTGSKRIGIFTRLTPNKPIDLFLFALHLLKDKVTDIVLNVYGNGDPVALGFTRSVEYLALNKNVVFKGHQADLTETALRDDLDLVWFHGYHATPGGFASFDLSSIGIPQIFWNFTPDSGEADQDVFPMYSNLKDFVEDSYKILQNPQYASDLGQRQFDYITEKRNIRKNVFLLEAILG